MVRTVLRNLQCGQRTTFTKNRVNRLLFTGTVDVSPPHEEQNLRRMVWFSVPGPTRTIHTAGTPHELGAAETSRLASLTVNSINRPASRHPFLISRARPASASQRPRLFRTFVPPLIR